jgi:WD40 repeat protein
LLIWCCLHYAGTEQQRITVGTSSGSPPCVWALEVLPDGTLVSGDQEGAVQFWDGRFGTLLARHQQFAADVLTLAASPDGKMVWASGVDPKVGLCWGLVTEGLRAVLQEGGCYAQQIKAIITIRALTHTLGWLEAASACCLSWRGLAKGSPTPTGCCDGAATACSAAGMSAA